MNKEQIDPIEDLKNIRSMMEKSTKFLSLSGLSGIFAGLTALVGAFLANRLIESNWDRRVRGMYSDSRHAEYDPASWRIDNLSWQLLLLAVAILIIAVLFGFLFTYIKAKRNQQKLNHPIAFKVFWSMMIPLAFGGLFTLILLKNGVFELVAPATLVFYGMSLLNASKYLNVEIKYLAVTEMILGILAGIFDNNGLVFWAIGFGVMHIFYGAIMYIKYDRK